MSNPGANVMGSYASSDLDGVVRDGGIECSGSNIGKTDCQYGDHYDDNGREEDRM